jgi:hypothetical protein
MVKQEKPGRKGVENTALSNDHREHDAFPGHVVRSLVILEAERLQKGIAGEPAIEEERGDAELAAPAIKGIEGSDAGDQPRPDETTDDVDPEAGQDRVEQIDPGRITQFTERLDRVIRPERDAAGEMPYVSKMKEVAEVIRRLFFTSLPSK